MHRNIKRQRQSHAQPPSIPSPAWASTNGLPREHPALPFGATSSMGPDSAGGGESWTCCFGTTCGVTLQGTGSAAAVRSHLRECHGIEIRSKFGLKSVKCMWTEQGGSPCSTDIRYNGLTKHICDVHLRVGSNICPYCGKKLSRLDSMKRHIGKLKCRALQAQL